MSKKQSSIEWLENEINRRGPKDNNPPQWLKEIFEQAKAMHKEEVRVAYMEGAFEKMRHLYGKEFMMPTDYYNETFGGQE